MFFSRIALAIIVALAGVGGVFTFMQQEVQAPETIPPLTVHHEYRKGTHFFVGTILVNTECHVVSGEAVVTGSYPEQVTLKITTQVMAPDCPPKSIEREFKIAFEASAEAIVSATIDNQEVPLKVEEVKPGEHLSL